MFTISTAASIPLSNSTCPPTPSKWQFRPRSFHHTQIEPSVISRFQKSSVRHSRKGPHAEHQWPNPSTDQGWPEITSVDPILGNSWEISWEKTACLVDLGKFPENHDQHRSRSQKHPPCFNQPPDLHKKKIQKQFEGKAHAPVWHPQRGKSCSCIPWICFKRQK